MKRQRGDEEAERHTTPDRKKNGCLLTELHRECLAQDTTAAATICLLVLHGMGIDTCPLHSTESGSQINFINFIKGLPHYLPIGVTLAVHWIMSLLPQGSLPWCTKGPDCAFFFQCNFHFHTSTSHSNSRRASACM